MGGKRIGEILRDKGLITAEQQSFLVELQEAQSRPIRFGALACEQGLIDERTLTVLLAAQHQVPIVLHLERIDIDPDAVEAVPREIAERFMVVPMFLYDSGTLVVAATDPKNEIVFRALEQHTGMKIRASIAPEGDIISALERVYEKGQLWAMPEAMIQLEEDQHEGTEKIPEEDKSASWGAFPLDPKTNLSSFGAIDDVFAQVLDDSSS